MTFIKVSAPLSILQSLSAQYNIDLEYLNHNYVPDTNVYFKFMETRLIVPKVNDLEYNRAP